MQCIRYLPVLVIIISVSRSWNLSQRSFVSNTHSTYFSSSQLHFDRIRILSSLVPFFFMTLGPWSLSLGGECWEPLLDERWWPFCGVCLRLDVCFIPSLPASLHRSISTSSSAAWNRCLPKNKGQVFLVIVYRYY